MTYNAEGKRTSLENLAGQVTTTAWDCCHKVSEVQPDGSTTTWDYDDEGRMGRRVQYLEISGSATNANNTFTYDKYLCIARHRTLPDASTETDRFIWDPTEPIATRPLVFNYSTTPTAYYTHDGNKNVSETVNGDENISAHYEYDIYGSNRKISGQTEAFNPWHYSCEHNDREINIAYYIFRHFNPHDGRWMSRDPAAYDTNAYAFVRNVPHNLFDFLGLKYGNPVSGPNGPVGSAYPYDAKELGDELSILYRSDQEGFDLAEFLASIIYPFDHPMHSKEDFNPMQCLSEHDCIKSLILIMHGAAGGINESAVEMGDDTLFENTGQTGISDLFKDIRFCNRCIIEIRSCYQGRNNLLKTRLHDLTGCEILLYSNRVDILGREEQ